MLCRVSLLLTFTALSYAVPRLEYQAIALRADSSPATSALPASFSGNLTAYCSAQFNSFVTAYQSNVTTTLTTTVYQGFYASNDVSQTGPIVSQSYSTSTTTYVEEGYQIYYSGGGAKPPCCSTCHLSAGTVQFYWWPDLATATSTPASAPSPFVTAVQNGFTFTSPSVYIAFSSIGASNFCGQVGDIWTSTTIAFSPDEISTVVAFTETSTAPNIISTVSGSLETILGQPTGTQPPPRRLTYSDLGQNCSTVTGYEYFPDDPQNDIDGDTVQDPCHPVIVYPDSLLKAQQAWVDNNCSAPTGFGAYDPPKALTQADAAATGSISLLPGAVAADSTVSQTTMTLASATPSITVGSQILRADNAGHYVVGPGSTLSVNGSSITVNNTVYGLRQDNAGQTELVEAVLANATSLFNTTRQTSSTSAGASTTSASATKPKKGDAAVTGKGPAMALGIGMLFVAML